MSKVFRFHDFVLDCAAFELRRGARLVPVEPLVLDLLMRLLEQPGVVLSRDALLEQVCSNPHERHGAIQGAISNTFGPFGGEAFSLWRRLRPVWLAPTSWLERIPAVICCMPSMCARLMPWVNRDLNTCPVPCGRVWPRC